MLGLDPPLATAESSCFAPFAKFCKNFLHNQFPAPIGERRIGIRASCPDRDQSVAVSPGRPGQT
ncbi:MAG: hypothetical protein OYG32_08845, partial [Rhodospirillaceae bacterium]|nr:hypothetical protein [Rhodospirillaceae bacterium]